MDTDSWTETGSWMARVFSIALLIALIAGTSACGRKGPLEPHPAQPRTKATSDADSNAQRLVPGNDRKRTSAPIHVPDRPFILDPLL